MPRDPRRASRRTRPSQRSSCRSASDVEAGATLADAHAASTPRPSTTLYANMVAAGEAGGILDTILKRLADLHREERQAQGARSRRAMIYPVAVIVDRRRRRRGHPAGRSSRRSRRCSRASAPSCRCRPQIVIGAVATSVAASGAVHRRRRRRGASSRSSSYYATDDGRRVDRPAAAASCRCSATLLRKIAVARFTPHARHADLARACRSSTASRSPPRPPATRSSRTPS
ncbi:MAG: type II secretion system F family protein [Candidatus Moduliflexus flocculans]|nr:type II secretion system F family protein [Candidatus Moduliflexus flocculans]